MTALRLICYNLVPIGPGWRNIISETLIISRTFLNKTLDICHNGSLPKHNAISDLRTRREYAFCSEWHRFIQHLPFSPVSLIMGYKNEDFFFQSSSIILTISSFINCPSSSLSFVPHLIKVGTLKSYDMTIHFFEHVTFTKTHSPLQLSLGGSSKDAVLVFPEGSVAHADIKVMAVIWELRHTFLATNGWALGLRTSPVFILPSPQVPPSHSRDTNYVNCISFTCFPKYKLIHLIPSAFLDPENITNTSPPLPASSVTLDSKASNPSTFVIFTIIEFSVKKR